MIDGREELGYVTFQTIYLLRLLFQLPKELYDAIHGIVAAFKLTTGKGIEYKKVVPYRLDHVHDCMMNDTIPKRRHINGALFRLEYAERPVWAGLISPTDKIFLNGNQILFEIVSEPQNLVNVTPPKSRFTVSLADVLECDDLGIKIAVTSHGFRR